MWRALASWGLLVASTAAQSEIFPTSVIASESGEPYVVVFVTDVTIPRYELQLCRRRAGAKPMSSRWSDDPFVDPSPVERDPKDTLVATATYDGDFLSMAVPNTFPGVLLLDRSDSHALSWIDGTGRTAFSLSPDELFGNGFFRALRESTTARVPWLFQHFWFDEARRSVVLVSHDYRIREIDLASALVAQPAPPRLRGWIERGPLERRKAILNALTHHPADSLRPVQATLSALFEDEAASPVHRMCAGLCLQKLGPFADLEELFRSAIDSGERPHRGFALLKLARAIGAERAIPILCREIPDHRRATSGFACTALKHLGASAAPALCALLEDGDQTIHRHRNVAFVLRFVEAENSIEALTRALARDDEKLTRTAFDALIRIAPRDLDERFARTLQAGCADDMLLVRYFQDEPTHLAIPALLEAAPRFPVDSEEHELALDTLKRCRRAR